MAEIQEDIIIIQDSDAAYNTINESSQSSKPKIIEKKKILFLGIGAGIFLILIIAVAIILLQKKSSQPISLPTSYLEDRLENEPAEIIEPSKLENMIAKADYLYSSGSKNEALSIYEKIAHYSEAVSAYNLGVAQLKDNQYETALSSFQKAIQNNEKRCVSAINAAVCSIHLNNKDSFIYYIDLAYAYLPQERQSELYSYYYSLINYYKGNYFETLSSLSNPTTDEYIKVQNILGAKINAMFNNDYKAIENFEKNENQISDFSLGLLYARVGDLTLAKKYLQNSLKNNIEPIKSQLALGFINLKAGQIQDAAKDIENVTDMFEEKAYKDYPIRVSLKKSLFDLDEAQNRYRNITIKNKSIDYQKIFYFSPYRIFNANQVINYIRKGNANIFIDNISSAQEYLQKSASSSSANSGIVKAIQKALVFRLREANDMLQELVKIQPKHSILHYNLALTYAQLGNMVDANRHFLRSYNLDAKNYLSGIYAIMTAQLINKDSTKLLSIIKDSILHEELTEHIDFCKTLLFFSEGNIIATNDWLDKNYKQSPIYLALDTMIAIKQNKMDLAQKVSKKLAILLPNEILPHLMYIDTQFGNLKPKEYASEVINYLKLQEFNFNDLYFGPHITRYLYIQHNLITGRLYFLRKQLEEVLESTTEHKEALTSALALASLYDGAYEKSFVLYNNLIDNLKVRDSQTLFLGAVASTAANHHANAIALLELSKLKDSNFLESRYALGLLYLEAQNNKGAVIQFSKINKNNFSSEYFDFNIDTEKLIFEKFQRDK